MPTIDKLSAVDEIFDADHFIIYSTLNGDARKVSASTVKDYVLGIVFPSVTQNQLRTWLASNGSPVYIYTVENNVPSDIANPINIAWFHSNKIEQYGTLYNFIQATLGFSQDYMNAAFLVMQGLAE